MRIKFTTLYSKVKNIRISIMEVWLLIWVVGLLLWVIKNGGVFIDKSISICVEW